MIASRAFAFPALFVLSLGADARPAVAQEGFCAGLAAGAPWMGQSRGGSDIATAPGPLAWMTEIAAGTRGIALFTLSAPMPVRIEAAPTRPDGDAVIELFDAEGRLVVFDDDSGGGTAARAEPELAAGDYCVAAMGFGGVAVDAVIQVSRLEMRALTPGLAGGFAGTEDLPPFVGMQPCLSDTPAIPIGQGPVDAATLLAGLRASGTAADTPYFRFTLESQQILTISATNEAADPYIYLFDAAGDLIVENDDFDGLNSRIDFTQALPAGTYCIGLRALSDPTLPIEVSLSSGEALEQASQAYANGDLMPPLDGSWPVEDLGMLPPQTDFDWPVPGGQAQWFAMEVPTEGLLLITADEVSDSDPVISFFDAQGQFLGQNDDANDSLNAQLAVPVAPGRYMLAVRQFDLEFKGVIRIGLSRFVPADR